MKKIKYIVFMFMFIFLILFFVFDVSGSYKVYMKYNKYFKVLYLGERMRSKNLVMQNCNFPKISSTLNKDIENISSGEIKCINKSELIYIGPYYNDHAVATFRCLSDNLVVEYSWTDFKESCSIIVSKEEWNLPERLTIEKLNSP